jgi:hypothetical protein
MNKVLECRECSKVFRTAAILDRHIKLHARLRPFKSSEYPSELCERGSVKVDVNATRNCRDCRRAFLNYSALAQHIEREHIEEETICRCPRHGCAQVFLTKAQLELHLVLENGAWRQRMKSVQDSLALRLRYTPYDRK